VSVLLGVKAAVVNRRNLQVRAGAADVPAKASEPASTDGGR